MAGTKAEVALKDFMASRKGFDYKRLFIRC